jgi:D-aspartate ligase
MAEAQKHLQPVILGGDIGAYSLAREFYEGYRVKSIVISGLSTGIMRHSNFVNHIAFDGIDDAAAVVANLEQIAAENSDKDLIVVASADWLVKVLVQNREVLEAAGYTVPYTNIGPFEALTTKAGFYEACERLGVPYPKTRIVPINDGPEVEQAINDLEATGGLDGFTFPLIAKASSTSAYHEIEFEGKKKVHKVDTPAELAKLLQDVQNAGYQGDFIIQDYIPGDDSGMRILTCYSDREGKVRFAAYGEVLLEEHAPGALGNPAAIITKQNPDAVAAATRILEDAGWTGVANFDLKYDPRDGVAKFFELNPRLGRSNYYITGAGANPVKFYVAEWLRGRYPDPITVLGGHVPLTPGPKTEHYAELSKEHLYTVVPLPLLARYVFNPEQRKELGKLVAKRAVSNPMWSKHERQPRRLLYVAIAQLNQYLKFHRHYSVTEAKKNYDEAEAATRQSEANGAADE